MRALQALELARPGRVLRRWLAAILLCPILAAASAGAVSRLLPPVWQSEAQLVVQPAQPLTTSDAAVSQLTSDQVMLTYAVLLTTRPLLESVISHLGLDLTPQQLRGKIRVDPEPNTTILDVSVRDTNRQLATDMTNRLVQEFVQQLATVRQQQNDQFTGRISSQIRELEAEIARDQATISALESARHPLSTDEQAQLNTARQELSADELQHGNLVTSLAQIEAQRAKAGDSVIVVSSATPSEVPASPRSSVNSALAGSLALLVTLVLLFGIEYLDQSIRSDEDLLERTGLVALGRIPLVQQAPGRRGELVALAMQEDPVTEAYKALRTNLLFSTIERPASTLVVTSAMPDEGKSRTTANLAVVMAAAGHRTLVIDADFRRSRLHGMFGRVRNLGLSNLMVGDRPDDELITPVEGCPHLWLLASGPRPPNPSELLGSGQMKKLLARFREQFTYVLIDTPPVNVVTDPCVLAAEADATVLVIEQGRTTYPSLIRANQTLARVGANVIGVVFNKIQHRGDVYYYDSAYYSAVADAGQPANGAEPASRTAPAEPAELDDVGRRAAR